MYIDSSSRVYATRNDAKNAGISVDDINVLNTAIPSEYNPEIHQLDIETGTLDIASNTFTFAVKSKIGYVNFDEDGKFISKGYSETADVVEYPMYLDIDKSWVKTEEGIQPADMNAYIARLHSATERFAESARQQIARPSGQVEIGVWAMNAMSLIAHESAIVAVQTVLTRLAADSIVTLSQLEIDEISQSVALPKSYEQALLIETQQTGEDVTSLLLKHQSKLAEFHKLGALTQGVKRATKSKFTTDRSVHELASEAATARQTAAKQLNDITGE